MSAYLVTGGAGFIGSNIAQQLALRGDTVRVLDDLSTGFRENLSEVADKVEFIEGSITDMDVVQAAMEGMEFCLHQAAIPSVPYSIEHPILTNEANVSGTINVFLAARDAGLRRVVFASSSAIYGNTSQVPVIESLPRAPISPYAVDKAADEMYAGVFSDLYDIDIVGLRYFNVFGPRQRPDSAYAAVIPIFLECMLRGESPPVHGDGGQARDFSYIENIVEANIAACRAEGKIAGVYNVACGRSTSILELIALMNQALGTTLEPRFEPARAGDIRESWADIALAEQCFHYTPTISVEEGLKRTIEWFQSK